MKNPYFEKVNNYNIFCVENIVKNSKHVLIMCHGFRSNHVGTSRTFVNLEKYLINNGISSFRFDQNGCGNSDGDFIDSEFVNWVFNIEYFINKFKNKGYKVSILGQSMGGTASLFAVNNLNVGKLFLWMPDPVLSVNVNEDDIEEENGEKYKGIFFKQAYDLNFLKTLENYEGNISLVYGDKDNVVGEEAMNKVIDIVKRKNTNVVNILENEGHGRWSYDKMERVYEGIVNRILNP